MTGVPPPDGAEGVTGVPDEGATPPDPPPPLMPPGVAPVPFLPFFLVVDGTVTPPETGGATAGIVWLEFELLLLPPPLDAIAITMIRKTATAPSAMSRRRRYTAGLSRIASTRLQLYTRGSVPTPGLWPD
jgi:hypothetical protein